MKLIDAMERFAFGTAALTQADLDKELANNPSYPLQFYCLAYFTGSMHG